MPGIGFLVRQENRPKLLVTVNSTDLLFENIFFKGISIHTDMMKITDCRLHDPQTAQSFISYLPVTHVSDLEYRVTQQVDLQVLLISRQKLCFSTRRIH